MAKLVRLGSLYMDGKLKIPDISYLYERGKITIGDTSPGMALSWFRAAGLLWADRNIVCKISWEQLRELNLLYGVPVKIDGGGHTFYAAPRVEALLLTLIPASGIWPWSSWEPTQCL